ncbi:MAG: FHA domain-containing protein [SAR202 cluster bacterium]|nr:FHA domain-containing protein [SAR202 cluster bacterium]
MIRTSTSRIQSSRSQPSAPEPQAGGSRSSLVFAGFALAATVALLLLIGADAGRADSLGGDASAVQHAGVVGILGMILGWFLFVLKLIFRAIKWVVMFIVRKIRGGSKADDAVEAEVVEDDSAPPGTVQLSTVRGAAAWLVVRTGSNPGSVLEIIGDKVTIGKAEGSGVRLTDSSVDSAHALIRVQQGAYTLSDLGSRSGTWVNGKLEAGVVLNDGSKITVGTSELFFSKVGGATEIDDSDDQAGGVLLVRSGPAMGRSFNFGLGDWTIGSQVPDEGAQIDDPAVSQQHAMLRCMSRVCRLYDLGSTNGTKVDGADLNGVLLQNGDLLKFGETELQFVHEESV